ncbi:hypothetical protein J3D43_001666 [Paenibacillus xylanexedens]|nr:hypothetical protein [Paenibacillus xylanexedens]
MSLIMKEIVEVIFKGYADEQVFVAELEHTKHTSNQPQLIERDRNDVCLFLFISLFVQIPPFAPVECESIGYSVS